MAFDIKGKIEELVEKIKKNPDLLKRFGTEPVKVVEELLGVDLPDDMIEKVVEGVKANSTIKVEELQTVTLKESGLKPLRLLRLTK